MASCSYYARISLIVFNFKFSDVVGCMTNSIELIANQIAVEILEAVEYNSGIERIEKLLLEFVAKIDELADQKYQRR